MEFGKEESSYLAKSDLERPDGNFASVELTISHMEIRTLTNRETGEQKQKFVAFFDGKEKGVVLGPRACQLMATELGEPPNRKDSTAVAQHFSGKRCNLYVDLTVGMGGGLRIRKPQGQAAAPAQEPPPPESNQFEGADADSEIPF